ATKVNYIAKQAPYGNTFPRIKSKADVKKYRLSDAQVQSFRQNGFVHNVQIMTKEQVDVLRDGLEAIVTAKNGRESELIGAVKADPKKADSKLTYMQGPWLIDEAIHDLIFHPAITVKLTQLLDTPRVRFWHDQVFYKPAKTGGNVAWHQDYSYWQRSKPARHITCWIGLDDSRIENGCLQAVPGSHKWPLLDPTALMGDMEGLVTQLSPEQRAQFKPTPLEQPCGTCSFHHDHTVHGSYPNNSDRPRRAIVLNFMADGVLADADDGNLMPGAPPIPAGQPIQGDYFPLVIDLDKI
ncbi:MAG TPA: phytanoyl-CoA dioxygenase family protein, partial [Planctomycetota bacterium]|nr:phytanoyl-CoA dioxygenase family protein [Planctomycetota bacterium]